jgi:hypothetical protein
MTAIDGLHRIRGSLANTIRIQGTAIATDNGNGRMLGEPGGDGRRRALRQQVNDAVARQIDQDGAIAMAPPPGPLVDTDGLGGWHGRMGATRMRPGRWSHSPAAAAGREPGTRLPTEGYGDGRQGRDEPVGFAGGWCHKVWETLRKDAARTGRIPADEFPYHQLDVDGEHTPQGRSVRCGQ